MLINKKNIITLLLSVFLLWLVVVPVTALENFAGEWQGTIDVPGSPLGINVFFTEENGSLTGLMDIPVQGAYDIGLTSLTVEDQTINFKLQGIPGDPQVNAKINDNGDKIEGDFTQAGMSFPIILTRKGVAPAELDISSLDDFGEFVEAVRQDWNTPGVAVGIVTSDEIIFAEGFGYVDKEESQPVTTETLFGIGSTTKPFTTMLLGMLVEEDKLAWDRPVQDYMKFKLKDDPLSGYITARDLVSHRSGLPRYDFTLIFNQDLTRQKVKDNLYYMERNQDFRNSFQYGNYSYIVAGLLAEEITGLSWEENIRERILSPLGMDNTNLSIAELKESQNYALPFISEDNFASSREIDFWELGPAAPAGSINAGVEDMSKWMQLLLNNGRHEGEQLLRMGTINTLYNPVNMIAGMGADSYTSHMGYGLGWFASSYRGHYKVTHDGVTLGFSAGVTLIPEENIGVVVLSNLHGSPVTQIIANTAIDRLLGLEEVNWKQDYLDMMIQMPVDAGFSIFQEEERRENTSPSHELSELTGIYSHPLYGTFQIELEEDRLVADYHGTAIELEHWHYNVFVATVDIAGPMELALQFKKDLQGNIKELEVGLDVFMTQNMIGFGRE